MTDLEGFLNGHSMIYMLQKPNTRNWGCEVDRNSTSIGVSTNLDEKYSLLGHWGLRCLLVSFYFCVLLHFFSCWTWISHIIRGKKYSVRRGGEQNMRGNDREGIKLSLRGLVPLLGGSQSSGMYLPITWPTTQDSVHSRNKNQISTVMSPTKKDHVPP
jgi:hypothetical protein